jgi:hypothetical protein
MEISIVLVRSFIREISPILSRISKSNYDMPNSVNRIPVNKGLSAEYHSEELSRILYTLISIRP